MLDVILGELHWEIGGGGGNGMAKKAVRKGSPSGSGLALAEQETISHLEHRDRG